MRQLPAHLWQVYRLASGNEVRSWSFGCLRNPRGLASSGKGTLDDQAIFGPLKEDQCACGKYQGATRRGIICDRCGVKIGSPLLRRARFGHINLQRPVAHPLGKDGEQLDVWPVLPAAYWESSAGKPLADLYERIVVADAGMDFETVSTCVDQIVDVILPGLVAANSWNIREDMAVFGQGVALVLTGKETLDDLWAWWSALK